MKDIFQEIKTSDKIPTYKYFVFGSWQESGNRRKIEIFSPIDGSPLGRIQSVLPKEAEIAVCGASMAWQGWYETPLSQRKSILEKTAKLLEKNKQTLANFLVLELGKPKINADHEVSRTISIIREYIKEFKDEEFKIKVGQETALLKRVPRGVILCIAPFNYPLSTTATKIIPALITGNSLILKPSIFGSMAVLHFVALFKKAGLPDGVLNVITGRGEGIGRFLAQHDLINLVSFTGSTKVGREIAQRAKMVEQVFELGGKDPAIILFDANLDKAASEIAKGTFSFSGQRCVAVKRVLIAQNIKAKFLEKLIKETQNNFSKVGDPRDEKTQLGPVISDKQADYLESLLKDALKKGAKVVFGGRRFSAVSLKKRLGAKILELPKRLIKLKRGQGRYFEPTILDKVTPAMKIAWEEQFGPILPILTVKNEKEAINLANASEYGLDTYIFTKNLKKAKEITDKLEVGQVYINTCFGRSSDHFPFTGVKKSGLGTQGIKYSIEAMTIIKAMRE